MIIWKVWWVEKFPLMFKRWDHLCLQMDEAKWTNCRISGKNYGKCIYRSTYITIHYRNICISCWNCLKKQYTVSGQWVSINFYKWLPWVESIIVPDFTSSVYSSSCNSLFFGPIISYFFLVFPPWLENANI